MKACGNIAPINIKSILSTLDHAELWISDMAYRQGQVHQQGPPPLGPAIRHTNAEGHAAWIPKEHNISPEGANRHYALGT